jgi:hypothetical protein
MARAVALVYGFPQLKNKDGGHHISFAYIGSF